MSINTGGWESELPEELATVVHDEESDVEVAHLKEIRSKASSLGATSASAGVIRKALNHTGGVVCGRISDELAMKTCFDFAGKLSYLENETLAHATSLSRRGSQVSGGAGLLGYTFSCV